MSKLMILGGSNCQLHALRRARERGIETVLIDYTDHPPGKEYADVHIPVSTFDHDACIKAAREAHIDGVLAVGTDQPVYTAALVAEALRLPSALTGNQALRVTNKREMKDVYQTQDIPSPPYMYLNAKGVFLDASGKEATLSLNPPYVIKPADAQGQRGVFRVSSKEALLRRLPETLSFSKEEICIVEEYIESDEMTVSGWVEGGVLHPLTIVDRLHYPDDVHIGVCTGHRYPSRYIAQKEEIIALSRRITEAFALREGPFYFQILRTPQGTLFAGEIACRIGGAFEDITIPQLTGFDILDAAIDLSLGIGRSPFPKTACHDDTARETCFVALIFCRPGRIRSITPAEEILSLAGVADCGYNFQEGETIPVMHNATARFGHAVVFGDDDTLPVRVRRLFETLRVENGDGENLLFLPHAQGCAII